MKYWVRLFVGRNIKLVTAKVKKISIQFDLSIPSATIPRPAPPPVV